MSARSSNRPVASAGCPGVELCRIVRDATPARIWSARTEDGRAVAVFALQEDALPASRRQFLQDAGALARVTREAPNPGILRVHALAPDGASFVADLWERGTLVDLVARGASLDKKLGMIRRICAALTAAHAQCVYFGRLRPDSIVLDDDLCPVIAELGASADATREEGRVYVAPEARLSGAGDARADVYALGRLMQFMFLERDPDDVVELLPALDELCELPAGLVRIVRRCLSSDAGTRYRSVASVAADLGRYHEAERVGLGHPYGKERVRPRASVAPESLPEPSSRPAARSGVRAIPLDAELQPADAAAKSAGVLAKVAGSTLAMLALVGVVNR